MTNPLTDLRARKALAQQKVKALLSFRLLTDAQFLAFWDRIKDRMPRDAEWKAAYQEHQLRFPVAPYPYGRRRR